MKQTNVREVKRLVNKWRKVLNLDPTWQIFVAVSGDLENKAGQISYTRGRWEIYLTVLDDFSGREADLEETVVHELLEVCSIDVRKSFDYLLENLVSDEKIARVLDDRCDSDWNRLINRLVPVLIKKYGEKNGTRKSQ